MPDNNKPLTKDQLTKLLLEGTAVPESKSKPGTLDEFGKQGVIDVSFGDKNYGVSKYDTDNLPSDYIENNEFQYLRGEKQTKLDKLANGFTSAVLKTGVRTINGIVSPLYGIGSSIYNNDASKMWDNEVNKATQNIEDGIANLLPAYKTHREENAHGLSKLAYMNTYTNDILDGISYSAAAYFSGAGVGKLASLVGKLAPIGKASEFLSGLKNIEATQDIVSHINKYEGIYKSLADGTKNGAKMFVGASTEASMESLQSSDEFYNKMKSDLTMGGMRALTDGEESYLQMMKKQVGNSTYVLNLPVIMADNWLTFGRTMLTNKATNSAVKEAAERTAFDASTGTYKAAKLSTVQKIIDKSYGLRQFTTPMISEGNQEMLQYAVTKGTNDYYTKKYYNLDSTNFLESMQVGLKEAYGTAEGWDAGLIGALSSGIFGNVVKIKSEGLKGYKNPLNADVVNKAADYLNEYKGSEVYKNLLDSYVRHSNLTKQQDDAIVKDDAFAYGNASSDMFVNLVTNRLRSGKVEDLKSDLETFKKLTPAQLEEQGIKLGNNDFNTSKQSVADYVKTRLDNISKLEKLNDVIEKSFPNASNANKERLLHSAYTLEDTKRRIGEIESSIKTQLSENANTADIVAINILNGYNSLPKVNRVAAKAAIANSATISPIIQDEVMAKLADLDKLVDRREEFINAYKALKNPKLQDLNDKIDEAAEAKINNIVAQQEPEETEETPDQVTTKLETVAEEIESKPVDTTIEDNADLLSSQLGEFADYNPDEITSDKPPITTEKTAVSEVPETVVEKPVEVIPPVATPVESKESKNNPREIYPGLNNDGQRANFKLPDGKTIRFIINEYSKVGIDINTKLSLRPYVNTKGANTAIITLQKQDGSWIDLGNINSFETDALTSAVITLIHKKGSSMTPRDLGIYFSMTDKVLDVVSKDEDQPSLSKLDESVKVNGNYLIYDRNNNYWADPNFDDSSLEIEPDFQAIQEFNKETLKNSRYILLVPNGNKYDKVRLRAEQLGNDDINSLFDSLKSTAVEFKADKELTAEQIDDRNNKLTGNLFIALNPDMKIDGKRERSYSVEIKVGKFGKLQAELSYRTMEGFKHLTEYFNISEIENIDSLLGAINKQFEDKHKIDLNLKKGDLQQQVDTNNPNTFRAAVKPNVFRNNFGNQLVFNELNIEEQPTIVQIVKIAEADVLNGPETKPVKEIPTDDDVNLDDLSDIQYSNGTEEFTGITEKEISEVKKLLPNFIGIKDINVIINKLRINGVAYGAFRKNIIYLNQTVGKPGTAYHEAFHAVFRTILTDNEIAKYLAIAKIEFKGDLKAAKQLLLESNPANSKLTDIGLEELVYEEYMADKFADYSKDKTNKSIGATLKQLFAKIINLFKGLFVNTDSSTVLFDKILAGSFANSSFQFNRFNDNEAVFKLLPRSYSKNDGLRFFTSTKSRLLINTLTAKVHKAILNGDNRTKSEILNALVDERYNELENDGYALVDKLMANNEAELANKVSSEIIDEQFVLDANSLKGQAQGLLKSEVLKRLELFSYVEKDIDSSEDLEDGDDTTLENNESDDAEIKEQYGSKDAWLTGGHDSLSKTIKEYIAFTTYTKIDPLTGKMAEFAVDEVTLYNGMIRILSDTKEDNMIDKLAIVAESNDNIGAFLERISKELGITKNEDGTYNTSSINNEAYNTFRLFVSNFKKSKAPQLMTTYKAGHKTDDYKTFNANTNDPKKISRDQWSNALYYTKENNKLTNSQLSSFIKDANKALVIGNGANNIQYLTEDNLNSQADTLKDNLQKVGITISKIYAKYSIVKAKQAAIVTYNENNDISIPFDKVLSPVSIKLLDLYNVIPITSDLLVGNNGINLSVILNDGTDPYDIDKGINGRLEEIADSNSYFDESIGNSSFTNAEGNRVYEIINLSYVLDKVNDLKSDTYWEKVDKGLGLTEIESKNFSFIKGNYLLKNHKDALKRIELNIINGFRNENDKDGITFGSYDKRTYFGNALALFATKTKGGLVRYVFRQNEASNTAYTASAPKISALNQKGGLSAEVKTAFYDKFLTEFNRITKEFAEKDNNDKQIIKGYNDSIEKGRAYRFAEFSYLAYINPILFNKVTKLAQEGNIEELKANEPAIKAAIENYLLNEGFNRFRDELERIGFIYNGSESHFVPAALISEYGTLDNALKEFYINDYLMSSSINELLDGDYALSRSTKDFVDATINGVSVSVPKNAYGIDISKRNKGGMASGPDYGNGNHTVSYIKDINGYIVKKAIDGKFIRVTKTNDKFVDENGNDYSKDDVTDINTNDAQSYSSQYHHIFGTMRLGRLDKKSLAIYKDMIQFTKRDEDGSVKRTISLLESDQEYLEKSLASCNSKKTITFDGIAGIYHKLSEAGLWRSSISYISEENVDTFVEYTDAIFELLKNDKTEGKLFRDLVSEVSDLYKPIPGMEYLHNLANKADKAGVDQLITESASKGATIKPVDSFNDDLKASSTLVRNSAKRLQTETPTGKDVITAGSQLINLIDTELDDNFEVPGFGTLGDIRDKYRELMSESRENSFKQAMTYIKDIEGSNGEVDITKLREKLVRSLEANNADESMLELFEKGYNLNLAAILDKAEQIVLAHFSKGVLNQKVNGTKVSLMSDAGIQVVRNEDDSVVGIHEVLRNPEKYKDYKTSPLKYNVKDANGRRFSEVLLSERILTKHGLTLGDTLSYEDIKNYPELFEAIGYRIPTQRHQSMMAMKVVGLMPNYYEGVGIFPMEIVYLSGADFDIDSEFIQLPQFWINKGKPIVYGTEKTIEDKWLGFKYYNVFYNKEFKSEYKKQLKSVDKSDKNYKQLVYASVSKQLDLPVDFKAFESYTGNSNAVVNNKSLELMIAMLTNDYVQENSANEGTTIDPMAEVSNEVNKLLEAGVANSKYKVPIDHVSASDINGKSTSNAKNSAGKAGIGIVANKVQQLTLLLKANKGTGIGLRDGAFRWSIGGKTSNGYHSKFEDNSVMDIMGVLLNVMTDNAKDPIAGNMNLTFELLNGYTEFLAQGADKYEAALVLNQPFVQLYGELKKVPDYTLKSSDENEITSFKILKVTLAKMLYGNFSKDTLNNLEENIKKDYDIVISKPDSVNLDVKQMESVLEGKQEFLDIKDYNKLQINALIQFTQLESQANDLTNLNTYLKLNQGLDISFTELRRNLDKADEKLNIKRNPSVHVDVLPLIKSDTLTYGNIQRAYKVLARGEKIFIEQTKDFRRGLEQLYLSLNESHLNKKGKIKKISREFLGYISTQAFKKYLNNIINTEKNGAKISEAESKLKGLNYSLVYHELGRTIVDQLDDLKNSDKDYIKNNSLVKYLKTSYKEQNEKGIDFIDGKSFVKESTENISLLLDGFKELMFDNDPEVKQFAINLLNYSIIKDNLQYKMGSIMKYISPGMFHTYSTTLDGINKGLNTNNNELLQDFDIMGYNFRKLFVTYIANEKKITLYRSIKDDIHSKIESNFIKFDANIIRDDNKRLTNFQNIFKEFKVEDKKVGYKFPQFYSFNNSIYELKELDNQNHNPLQGVGIGYKASYEKLEYHGNLNVSPYSFNTYEDALLVDKQVADYVPPVKNKIIKVETINPNDLILDISDISGNFANRKQVDSEETFTAKDLGLDENSTTNDAKC